jgi:Fe-S oxidoreductase
MGLARFLRLPLPGNAPPLHQRFKKRTPLAPTIDSPVSGKQIGLFCGCITNLAYPEMGEATAAVLERMGARVTFPQEQWCCGLPLMNAGDREGAKPLARQTIEMLEKVPGEAIVSNSASCVVAIQQDYQDLFKDEPVWRQRAATVGNRLVDFTSFVYHNLKGGPLPEALEGREVVTCHDSCQSHNCLGLREESRRVLKTIGVGVTEMEDCGFGGSFSVDYPEVSARVLRRKLDNIEATGAKTVVTDNPGCIMHLRGGLKGKDLHVLHLAEVLAGALASQPQGPGRLSS